MNNMPASVRARLLNSAKKEGVLFQRLLTLYNQEGLLHRIVSTEYKNEVVLKGGLLFYQLQGVVSRPTKDIDLLGIIDQSAEMSIRDYIDAVVRLFEEPFIIQNTPVDVKVSAGYAIYPENGESIDELVSSADSRMYHEKRRKRILENPVRTQISLDETAG